MRNVFKLVGTTAALTAAGLALTVAPATAAPRGGVTCATQVTDSRAGVRCTFPGPTTTRYRAWASCTNGRTVTGPIYYVNSGSWSWANCGTNVFVTRWGYDLFT